MLTPTPRVLFALTHYTNPDNPGKPRTSAVDWWRVICPYNELKRQGWNVDIRTDLLDKDEDPQTAYDAIGKQYDMVYSSYHRSGLALGCLEYARKTYGTHYMMDIDDDLFHLQPGNLITQKYAEEPAEYAKQLACIDMAEHINTTNWYLKNTIREESKRKRVHVVPNYIDLSVYKPIRKKKHDTINIGFMGTHSHSIDMVYSPFLYAMKMILEKYQGKVQFHILGLMQMDGVTDMPYTFHQHGCSDFYEYIKTWQQWTSMIDIGIAPLVDSHFNRGKSNIKPLEYGAASIPSVCSAVRQYNETITHGKDGFLAATVGDWMTALEGLITKEQLRQQMGKNILTTIKQKHTIQGNIQKWMDLFTRLYEHSHH